MTPPARPAASPAVIRDDWSELRRLTPARLALGRSGAALPTRAVLDFGLAYAQARDAVHGALDGEALQAALQAQGLAAIRLRSRAPNRAAYLARPDWGRRLHPEDAARLRPDVPPAELVIVLSDGLSARAVQDHALPLLEALLPRLADWRVAPLVIATQARVALADEVGERLAAGAALSLIGERPGLSAPDSLGAYLTWSPRVGRSDAERNCISNIRPASLVYERAADAITALLAAMRQARCSGVGLGPHGLAIDARP
jgi:ethanolamine ammonia-lyase small subunit